MKNKKVATTNNGKKNKKSLFNAEKWDFGGESSV